jgi:hypothetical protein
MDRQADPLEAWGGAALLCDPGAGGDAWCATAMLARDGPSWGARCLWFGDGALGNASVAKGNYCVCSQARSGPSCMSVNKGALLVVDLGDALCVVALMYLVRRALNNYKLLLRFDKAGSNRVMIRTDRWIGGVCVSSIGGAICSLIGSNAVSEDLSYDTLFLVDIFFKAATMSSAVACAATVTVTFYSTIKQAEFREPSAWHEPAATVFAVVICVAVTVVTFEAPEMYNLVILAGTTMVIVPAVDSAFKVKRLLLRDHTMFAKDTLILAALQRIRRMLGHALVYSACFLVLRVALATTGWAQSAYQGPAYYVHEVTAFASGLLNVYFVRRGRARARTHAWPGLAWPGGHKLTDLTCVTCARIVCVVYLHLQCWFIISCKLARR